MAMILGVIFTTVGLAVALCKKGADSTVGAVVLVIGVMLLIWATGGRWV